MRDTQQMPDTRTPHPGPRDARATRPVMRLTPRTAAALIGGGAEWRASWIARRARNVSRRPFLLGSLSGTAFLVALVAVVLVPPAARRAARVIAPTSGQRP